jgi:amino acid transporter
MSTSSPPNPGETPTGTVAQPGTAPGDEDAAQLAALGYESHFTRRMSLWENFSLGFTYLSPVVGVYSTFALAFMVGGPLVVWAIVIAGVGQLLVSLVFAEVVAQYPVAGGVYPWARRLVGRRWAWLTGWVYGWALLATVASVSTGAASFVAYLFGFSNTRTTTFIVAAVLILIAYGVNLSGTKTLGRVAMLGFIAEIVGALFVGIWLLVAERHHGFGVFVHEFGAAAANGYSPIGGFFAAALIGLYLFYGFEACGDVAEEVPDPGRRIPPSMRRTVYIGGFAGLLVTVALVLAQPNFSLIISGQAADPITATLERVFTPAGAKAIIVIVLISFLSCVLSLQAAASRLIYSYARDRMVFAGRTLSRFSSKLHVPPVALTVAAAIPILIVLIAELVSADALASVIAFASVGIYCAFQLVVLAALIARARGWRPSGKYRLGRWAWPVNIAAFVYGVAGAVDLAWPRGETIAARWSVLIGMAVIVLAGIGYMVLGKPYRGDETRSHDAAPNPAFSDSEE